VAGVAPIMLRMADGVVQTIAGLGYWPAATDPDRLARENGGHIPENILRTAGVDLEPGSAEAMRAVMADPLRSGVDLMDRIGFRPQ
jgi:hypothetical protein